MKRSLWRAMVGLIAMVVAGVGVLVVPAGAVTASFCGRSWGSLPKQVGQGPSPTPLAAVRAGRHACYDRLVFDLDGAGAGFNVRYDSQVLTQGGGLPLSLRGGAFVNVTLYAAANDVSGAITYSPPDRLNAVSLSGFRTFRQVAFGGSFEGYTTFGIGVRARLPFRAFVLPEAGSHSRVVVDVAHQW